MRVLVFLLILVNLLFFSYTQGYLGPSRTTETERTRLQLNPASLKVVARGEAAEVLPATVAAAPTTAPPAVEGVESQEGASPSSSTSTASSVPVPVPVAPEPTACIQMRGLDEDTASKIASRAQKQRLSVKRIDEKATKGWWVFIPAQPDRKSADAKADSLRQLGVSEYFVVSEGAQKFAISLGVFSSEASARKRLEEIKAKGVSTAQVGLRQADSGRQTLEVNGGVTALINFQKGLPAKVRSSKGCK